MLRSAIRVLRLYGPDRRALGMAEATRLLNEPATTVSRWLRAMADAGFLSRDPSSGRYHVGPALVEVAAFGDQSSALQRVGRRALEQLTAATGETTYLGVLQGSVAILVDGVVSPRPIHLSLTVGERVALHATATGKCLLAWWSAESISKLLRDPLPATTNRTISSVKRLMADLATARRRGYTVAQSEWEDDLVAAAAPIRNQRGDVVAALSVGGPASRFGSTRLEENARLTIMIADRASRELGWTPAAPRATPRREALVSPRR